MSVKAEQFMDVAGRERFTPKFVTTTYIYRPKTKKGAVAIRRGDYPENLNLFFHCIYNSQNAKLRLDNQQWCEDEKGPYMAFDIRETL